MSLLNMAVPNKYTMWIDPDGQRPLSPFQVTCERNSTTGRMDTVVHHGNESDVYVPLYTYHKGGIYNVSLSYGQPHGAATLSQIGALADASSSCRQRTLFGCLNIYLYGVSFLVSRTGEKLSWGGCSVGYSCNCSNWSTRVAYFRHDSGYLTDKSKLPVSRVLARIDKPTPGGSGYFKIGPLYCSA